MRFLLLKDLQILRRSPLLLGLLVAYALVIGLPVGFAVSRPPQKPKVAFLNEVLSSDNTVALGGRDVDVSAYADKLFEAIDPIRVRSRKEALDKVRSGEALGALIVPGDVTRKLQAAAGLTGTRDLPTLEVYYNADNPLKQRYVQNTIDAQVSKANAALTQQLTKVIGGYLDILLRGGSFSVLGRSFDVLGLQRSTTLLAQAERELPANDPMRAALAQVRRFAQIAVDNLDLSGPVLGAVAQPIKVKATAIDGPASSLDGYAIAAAITVAIMFTGVLLAAGMLALEREEHAFGRLVRGLVSPTGLLAEKVVLGGVCAAAVGALLLGLLALFRDIAWDRSALIALALALGALGFGALGVVIGAVTRDVRAASLLAFLLSLPIAVIALVPSGAVSGTAYDIMGVVSAVFPCKPTLEALDAALNDAGGGLGGPVLNLVAIIGAYGVVSRVALRRFAR